MNLNDLRNKIDAVDREVVRLLNERVALAGEVGKVKHAAGEEVFVPAREEQVFRRLLENNSGPLSERALRTIYREIISASIAVEKALRVAYLGPQATFTHQAALSRFGSAVELEALATIPDVFAAVEKGDVDYGVIPVENSTEGAVFHSLDMFVDSDLKIIAQIYTPIEHCLISLGSLAEINEVHSKDQALGQCRLWLQRYIPHARLVNESSTAESVRMAATNKNWAAVASRLAAEMYSVPVVATGIQDRADNVTRFLVVGRQPSPPIADGSYRTSIVVSINDRPGALQQALAPFSSRGINLKKIESRPSRRKAWDYLFFIDFSGHWNDPLVQETVADLEEGCPLVKWLGSYTDG